MNGRFVGLQVKTAVPARYGEAHFRLRETPFAAAANTWIAGLAWIEEQSRFADECLLVPTEALIGIAGDGGDRWVVNFNPDKPGRTPIDPYRRRLPELGDSMGRITSIE